MDGIEQSPDGAREALMAHGPVAGRSRAALGPRGSVGGRVVVGIVLVAAVVAACSTNVGEPAAVEAEAVALHSGPPVGPRPSPAPAPAPPAASPPPVVTSTPPAEVPTKEVPPSPSEPAPQQATSQPEVSPTSTTEPAPAASTTQPEVSPTSTTEPAPATSTTQPTPTSTTQPTPTSTTRPPPPAESPSWEPVTILTSKDDVNGIIPVYDSPDGTRLSFPDGELWSYTFRGNRLVVRVTQGSPGDEWVQAELPVRPSGVRGWIRTENFNWSTVSHHILIDVSARSVTLYDGDDVVVSTRAIVGKPSTPTPTLSGFIVEKLPNHSQQNASVVLGDWILMLSFFSEALPSFGGGLPRIALHGTHIPERVGEALSNGCIRIPNNIVETIARRAPLGTVVHVVA